MKVIYCDVANEIGIVDEKFKDTSLTGFWVRGVFRVTAFPVFLGEL